MVVEPVVVEPVVVEPVVVEPVVVEPVVVEPVVVDVIGAAVVAISQQPLLLHSSNSVPYPVAQGYPQPLQGPAVVLLGGCVVLQQFLLMQSASF